MLLAGAVFALRRGLFIGPSPVAFAIWTAVAWRCAAAWRSRRHVPSAASNFTHPG
jgi:hypothetical protein